VTCLFASSGFDLRAPLRDGASDEELTALIERVWTGRSDRYSEQRGADTARGSRERIEMYQIGG
jgi:cyclic pyranopterin phosphate synthase